MRTSYGFVGTASDACHRDGENPDRPFLDRRRLDRLEMAHWLHRPEPVLVGCAGKLDSAFAAHFVEFHLERGSM